MWDFVVPNATWRLSGSCASTGNPDLWYSDNRREIRQAQLICWGCPVLKECLIFAFENKETFGVWGGMTAKERKRAMGNNGH